MDILEKCLMLVFCQRGRAEDQLQIQTFAVEQQPQQKLPPAAVLCPGRGIRLAGVEGSHASYSPARLEVISISVDIHRQPDTVPEPRCSSLSICRRSTGLTIEDDIEILASMQHTLI